MNTRSEYTANIELASATKPVVTAPRVNIASGNRRVVKAAVKPGFIARLLGA